MDKQSGEPTIYTSILRHLPKSMPLSLDVATYVSCIGSFKDYSGGMAQLLIDDPIVRDERFDGIVGLYGRVTWNNPIDYATIPSPGVALLQVLRECQFAGGESNWMLPKGLTLNEPRASRPNRNFLCWRPLVQFLTAQKCGPTNNVWFST